MGKLKFTGEKTLLDSIIILLFIGSVIGEG